MSSTCAGPPIGQELREQIMAAMQRAGIDPGTRCPTVPSRSTHRSTRAFSRTSSTCSREHGVDVNAAASFEAFPTSTATASRASAGGPETTSWAAASASFPVSGDCGSPCRGRTRRTATPTRSRPATASSSSTPATRARTALGSSSSRSRRWAGSSATSGWSSARTLTPTTTAWRADPRCRGLRAVDAPRLGPRAGRWSRTRGTVERRLELARRGGVPEPRARELSRGPSGGRHRNRADRRARPRRSARGTRSRPTTAPGASSKPRATPPRTSSFISPIAAC